MNTPSTNQGFVRTIILIVVALLILSYFGLNLRTIVNSPVGKDNFTFTQEIMISVWNNYLKTPVMYVWHIFVDLIWDPAIDMLNDMAKGDTSTTTPVVHLSLPKVVP